MKSLAPLAAATSTTGPSRRTLLRFMGVSAAAVVATGTLASCAGESGSGATTASGKTVLKVYGWKGGKTEPANIEQVNQAFSAANPTIDLQFEYVPANDAYTQRVQPELLAGEGADVIMTDSSKIQDWGKAGYLEDLGGAGWVSTVSDTVAPFIRRENTVHALPMEIIGIGLYANRTLLDAAGVTTLPTTWSEFTAALTAAKASGVTAISLPNKGGWTYSSAVNAAAATTVYQATPDWDSQFLAGKASFSDWSSAVDQLEQLGQLGFVDLKAELGVDEWTQGLADFTAGKSAFWVQGAWNQSAVEKAGVKDAFIPWPAGPDGSKPSANLFVGTMWSVNKASKAKDASQKYLEFWADSANAKPFLEAENAVSPFTGGQNPSSEATADFVKAFEEGRFRVLPSNTWFSADGEKTMQTQLQALALGQVDTTGLLKGFDSSLRSK